MTNSLPGLAALASLAALAASCASEDGLSPDADLDQSVADDEPPSRDDAADDQGVEADDTSGPDDLAGPIADPPECNVPEFEDDSPIRAFSELRAQVVDIDRRGVANVLAQACGMNICLFGETDDAGFILHQRSPPTELRRAAFKYGDGLKYAQFAYVLPETDAHDLGQQATIALPSTTGAKPFEPGTTVSSGGVTLGLADELVTKIDFLSYPEERQHRFVAAEIPNEVWPLAVPEDAGLELLFALGPLKTEFCPRARITVPNSLDWETGTEVEFLLHVTDTANHFGRYGDWGVVGRGEVDEGGEGISSSDQSGIPQLGVIGIRRLDLAR
jgi:hypothetical protein